MRSRITLWTGLLALFVLAALGPGLITRRDQHITCTAEKVGCADANRGTAAPNPFDYDPGDGRVPGNAGDAIAIYCQPEYRNINVYAIRQNTGTFLAGFEAEKLRKAGPVGLSANLGAGGSVAMTLLRPGHYYVLARGSNIAGSGQNAFAKPFTCGF